MPANVAAATGSAPSPQNNPRRLLRSYGDLKHTPVRLRALPKTAGTSVRHHFRKNMPEDELAALNVQDPEPRDDQINELRSRGEKLRLLMGHRATRSLKEQFPDRPIRWITNLREPAGYMVSRFNYGMKDAGLRADTPETEEQFRKFCERARNGQARWFITVFAEQEIPDFRSLPAAELAQQAREILADFWHIGSVENLPHSFKRVFDALHIPRLMRTQKNVAGTDYKRLVTLTDERRAFISDFTDVDDILYQEFAAGAVVPTRKLEKARSS